MTKQELRKRLRADGFINAEIYAIHCQYLIMRAVGVPDEDLIFDREHGVLVHERAKHLMNTGVGREFAPDVKRHTTYEFQDGKLLRELPP